MNKLAIEGKYDELIRLYESTFGDYQYDATDASTDEAHPNRQEIPTNHINLLFEAFYFSVGFLRGVLGSFGSFLIFKFKLLNFCFYFL